MADPIQGLIDFVLAQKPYHTKILDTLVNYTHDDEVDVTFTENQLFEIGMIIEAELSDSSGTPESIVETCPNGWGDTWDQPGQFLVVYANDTLDVVYVIGDATASFTAGVVFEIRDPDNIDPDLLYTVDTDATYDAVTDRTAIPVVENILPGDFITGLPPANNDNTVGNVFPTYSVVSTTIVGNVIVVSGVGINVGDFQTGYAVNIRNATEVALNKGYRIVAAVESGANEVTIFSSTNVTVDTAGDGEAVFAGFGFDEPPFCASSEQTVVRPVFAETLDIQTLQEPGAVPSYQFFILAADTGLDTFTVEGDVRAELPNGTNFQVLHALDIRLIPLQDETNFDAVFPNGSFVGGVGYVVADTITLNDGSVITVDADSAGIVTQFTVTTAGNTIPATPGETLTQTSTSGSGTGFTLTPESGNTEDNNDSYTVEITGVTYDPITNRSEIPVTGNITFATATGWIVPV